MNTLKINIITTEENITILSNEISLNQIITFFMAILSVLNLLLSGVAKS